MKQRERMSEFGSFNNWAMSNNSTKPEVGKGATIMLWTDRHAYEVMSVDEKQKSVTMRRYVAKQGGGGYVYNELYPHDEVFKYRYGAWRRPDGSKVNILFGVRDEHYDQEF